MCCGYSNVKRTKQSTSEEDERGSHKDHLRVKSDTENFAFVESLYCRSQSKENPSLTITLMYTVSKSSCSENCTYVTRVVTYKRIFTEEFPQPQKRSVSYNTPGQVKMNFKQLMTPIVQENTELEMRKSKAWKQH